MNKYDYFKVEKGMGDSVIEICKSLMLPVEECDIYKEVMYNEVCNTIEKVYENQDTHLIELLENVDMEGQYLIDALTDIYVNMDGMFEGISETIMLDLDEYIEVLNDDYNKDMVNNKEDK